MEKQSIVVGICGCTDLYHGELQGQDIQIGEIPEQGFGIPEILMLREQEIPERDQRKALQRLRPHFFLDAHVDVGHSGRYFIRLEAHHIVHGKTGSYLRLFSHTRTKYWNGEPSPSAEEMVSAIQGIVRVLKKRMTLEKWEAWLFQQ